MGFLNQSKFKVLPALGLLIWGSACGFYNPELSGKGPFFRPEVELPGKARGRQILYDRNDSIIDTAIIERDCTLNEQEPSVLCRLNIQYERSNRQEVRNRKYLIQYKETLEATIHLTSEKEDLKGDIYGSAFHLSGTGEVPGSDEDLSQELRFIALSEGEALETVLYSYLGFRSGKTVTFWQKSADSNP